jgi:hypothetical protein
LDQQNSNSQLAYALSGGGLISLVGLVALNRIFGIELAMPWALLAVAPPTLAAAGISLLFHRAALDRVVFDGSSMPDEKDESP